MYMGNPGLGISILQLGVLPNTIQNIRERSTLFKGGM